MKIRQSLVTERKRLALATKMVLHRSQEGEIDLDDTIEELRPIRMRIYKIDCRLDELRLSAPHSRED